MKVGILSMQRVKNYGSFLQAYSLKRNLEALGHEVQFVDYKVEEVLNKGTKQANKTSPLALFSALRRRFYKTRAEKFFLARKKFLTRYDTEFYDMLGLTKQPNLCPPLDVLVIGSDEVFNCLQTNSDVGFSRQLFGAENNAGRVITYAASFGNTTLERLKEYRIDKEVSELLKNINTFSVRDENSHSLIKELTAKESLMHLDPVFIYDYPEVDEIKQNLHDYIVVYSYSNRISQAEAKKIKAFAKKHKKKLVCIGEYQSFCDLYIGANPFELLSYIKHADYVITDTFHGTVFSIKYNKQFATILRDSSGNKYGNAEKLGSLLKKFDLFDRRVESADNLEELLLQKIDFSNVNAIIKTEKQRSREYLKENCI